MEIINFRAVERATQEVSVTLNSGNSERWTIQSQKRNYVNGKMTGVIGVGYTASINNSDYLLKEDKSNNEIQIKALADDTSGTCVLTQNETGNKINLHLITPPEEKGSWEIRFSPIPVTGVDTGVFFAVNTNISGESAYMDESEHKNWIVNQRRHVINIYISTLYPGYPGALDILSWSCLDNDGNAFSPNYNLPDNSYFTTKTIGLGSYSLTKISTPTAIDGTLMLSSRFNPTKKDPLDLNFYWGLPDDWVAPT